MFSILRQGALLLVTGAALLAACKKDTYELEGPIPTAGFTYSIDTTQYPVRVTFTNTTTDAFLYQWDFGDGTPLVSGQNVTHTYALPRIYDVRLVAAGRGGTGVAPTQKVIIPSTCGNNNFAVLTNCASSGRADWTLSDQPGAIKIFRPDGTTLISSSPATGATLPECQADDQFSFTNTFTYSYDAGISCTPGSNLSSTSPFVFRFRNGVAQIVLQGKGSFIGTIDSVQNKTYNIVTANATTLRLRGTLPNGNIQEVTFMHPLPPLQRAEQLLTGGSSRTWVLDNTVAATIVVGTEAAPTSYYAGGAVGSLPSCQADDEYTFTKTGAGVGTFQYDAKAETFVAGAFSCQAPRSLTTTYQFGPAAGAGLAQFTLAAPASPTAPQPFIGATDASAARIYRILSINSREMLLRTGPATADPIFTIKLRVK